MLETWKMRLFYSPVEWLLVGLAILFYFWSGRDRREVIPFLAFGVIMLALLLRVPADSPRYLTPFLPAFLVFAGLMLSAPLARLRYPISCGILPIIFCLVLWNVERQVGIRVGARTPRAEDILSCLRREELQEKELLVPQDDLRMIHYYFPSTRLIGYLDENDIPGQLSNRAYDGVLYPGYPVRYQSISRN